MTFDVVDRASTDIESWSKERDRQVNHLHPVHFSKTFPFWYLCLPGFFSFFFQKHTWKCLIHHNAHCLDGYLDLAHVSVRKLTLIVLIGRRSHPVDNHVLPMWRLPYYKSIEELCYILFCKALCKVSSRQISIHFQSFISFTPLWRIRVHICLWVSALFC